MSRSLHRLVSLAALLDVLAAVTDCRTVTWQALHPTDRTYSSRLPIPPTKVPRPTRVEPSLHSSVRTRLPPGIDTTSTREHRVSRETPGHRLSAQRPASTSLQGSEPYGPPHSARSLRGLPGGGGLTPQSTITRRPRAQPSDVAGDLPGPADTADESTAALS